MEFSVHESWYPPVAAVMFGRPNHGVEGAEKMQPAPPANVARPYAGDVQTPDVDWPVTQKWTVPWNAPLRGNNADQAPD